MPEAVADPEEPAAVLPGEDLVVLIQVDTSANVVGSRYSSGRRRLVRIACSSFLVLMPKGSTRIGWRMVLPGAGSGVGVRSPVRAMAGLEAEVSSLADATLTFMSPRVIDRSFSMRYLSDGGQMGLLGWPEGSAGWRTIARASATRCCCPPDN